MKRIEDIESEILNIKKNLNELPEGKFCCVKNGEYYRWQMNSDGKAIYIPKAQEEYAQKLAYRKYLTERLLELQEELKVSYIYVNKLSKPLKSDEILKNSEEMNRLITPFLKPLNLELEEWSKADYIRNPAYPEKLIHKSISGNYLRSKSEVLIDMLLFQAKIPYRYECQSIIGNHILYPDFIIRHPRTGKLYYWEHFGQMDNPEYNKKACNKIQIYISNGIIPTINLITTFETKDNPLTSNYVNELIEYYFK